jgi:hypothetical protein
MPFGLTNAPSTFIRVMNQILKPFIDKFVVVYFDDILIFNRSLQDHMNHLLQVFQTLRFESFFINLKKCTFAQSKVIFLGFIVSADGVAADPKKVCTVSDWPSPNNIHEVRSFHGLASFYWQFVKGFSSIMVLITECTKKGAFVWTTTTQKAFEAIKVQLTQAPILRLPNFEIPFEVSCDASHLGIGGVLSQNGHLVAFYSEKLNDARKRYSTYDLELFAVIQSLKHWRHYLIHREFVLFSDHDSLRHLHSQKHLNARHARWVEFLQQYTFVLKHKAGTENRVADALSRKAFLLHTVTVDVNWFHGVKEQYPEDPDFGKIYKQLLNNPQDLEGQYSIFNGFVFRGTKLCLPNSSMCEFVVSELHAGGLARHFGRDKQSLW